VDLRETLWTDQVLLLLGRKSFIHFFDLKHPGRWEIIVYFLKISVIVFSEKELLVEVRLEQPLIGNNNHLNVIVFSHNLQVPTMFRVIMSFIDNMAIVDEKSGSKWNILGSVVREPFVLIHFSVATGHHIVDH
jgi:hypothetical protein